MTSPDEFKSNLVSQSPRYRIVVEQIDAPAGEQPATEPRRWVVAETTGGAKLVANTMRQVADELSPVSTATDAPVIRRARRTRRAPAEVAPEAMSRLAGPANPFAASPEQVDPGEQS